METGTPKKIGRYAVDRLLGSGAMGFVYLGRDADLDRPVAIKTIRDLSLSDDARQTFLERFRNEARAAARLAHNGIVQVYDVGEDEAVGPYLVFEYVPGSTLKQILQSRGPLDPDEVVDLAEQVAAAVDTAHEAGIIHRDIKPDNLLLTADGRAKLADFGIARLPNADLTREGQFLGTPCYAAPETLQQGRYSARSDIFSLAAVLYEAAAGTRAFPGDEAIAVASKVIHDTPPAPSDVARGAPIPAEVDAVIMGALSKTPEGRPASAEQLAREVRRAYAEASAIDPVAGGENRGPRIRVTPPPPEAPPSPTRNRSLGFALAAGAAVLIGVVAIFALAPPGVSQKDDGDTDSGGVVVDPNDAGTSVAHLPVTHDHRDTRAHDAGAETSTEVPLVTIPPEGMERPDAGATGLTPHDLEERAKDQIVLAQRLMASHQWDDARKALAVARQDDPNNTDIARYEAELPPATPPAPPPTP